ncbi:MAG: DUF4149 domain-containing protein [Fibrobacteria bacterium]
MHALYLVSVWMHILAAAVWLGGAAFIALVLVPLVHRPGATLVSAGVMRAIVMRYRTVGWASLAVLIVTGCANLGLRGIGWEACLTGAIFHGGFGKALAIKLSLVASLIVISAFHDFYLGPRAAKIILEQPGTASAAAARRRASRFGRVVLMLGVLAVFAAVILVRGFP